MKQSIDLSRFFKPLGRFLRKFYLTIFIVIIIGGLAYAVTSLYGLLSDVSTAPADTTTPSSASFDQSTIDRLNQMYTSDAAPKTVTLPPGRTNPFGE